MPFCGDRRERLRKEFARLELKLFAAKLLQGYHWSLLPQNLTLVTVPTPYPKDGLQVWFDCESLQGVSATAKSRAPMA